MGGGVGVLGGGHIFFSKKKYFNYIKTPKKGIFNFSFFLTLWWVAGAGDEENTPKF